VAELTEPFDANFDERGANKHVRCLHDACEDWLTQAARLPGKALHLATVVQSLARAQNTKQVALSNLACQVFGIDRNAKYRALAWLNKAGLIAVERKLGRSPIVTILDRGGAE
jgi:hypothetical protein